MTPIFAPEIDFTVNLVLFARNTQFYNRINIGKVNVSNGVAEVLAMETMSAMPIEDKVPCRWLWLLGRELQPFKPVTKISRLITKLIE